MPACGRPGWFFPMRSGSLLSSGPLDVTKDSDPLGSLQQASLWSCFNSPRRETEVGTVCFLPFFLSDRPPGRQAAEHRELRSHAGADGAPLVPTCHHLSPLAPPDASRPSPGLAGPFSPSCFPLSAKQFGPQHVAPWRLPEVTKQRHPRTRLCGAFHLKTKNCLRSPQGRWRHLGPESGARLLGRPSQ